MLSATSRAVRPGWRQSCRTNDVLEERGDDSAHEENHRGRREERDSVHQGRGEAEDHDRVRASERTRLPLEVEHRDQTAEANVLADHHAQLDDLGVGELNS